MTSPPRKFIFDTSDKKNVIYNNGYYTLYFPSPIQCSKISVLECTLLHSFYNVDYYNNEIKLQIVGLNGDPFITNIYLTPGHYKTINDIFTELMLRIKDAVNDRTPGVFSDKNVRVILNEKTYKLSFQIIDYVHQVHLTFTNSFRLFGFQKNEDGQNAPHLQLQQGYIYTAPYIFDIVHNPAIYFRSSDLHTHTQYNSHITNIFYRMPVNAPFLNWLHNTNYSPDMTYFSTNGSLNQLNIRVTDYEGKDVFLNNGDFKFEFIVN